MLPETRENELAETKPQTRDNLQVINMWFDKEIRRAYGKLEVASIDISHILNALEVLHGSLHFSDLSNYYPISTRSLSVCNALCTCSTSYSMLEEN
jgi:hypothetical protein